MTDHVSCSETCHIANTAHSSNDRTLSYTHDNVLFRVACTHIEDQCDERLRQAEKSIVLCQVVKLVPENKQHKIPNKLFKTHYGRCLQADIPLELLGVGAKMNCEYTKACSDRKPLVYLAEHNNGSGKGI